MSKQGKKKNKVLSLGEFHSIVGTSSNEPARMNWADEMEKLDDTNTATPPPDFVFDRSQLPTATKAALAPDLDLEAIPKKAPFTAHLSNVSFEADEAKIRTFFRDSKILNVRLPLDERGRFKGHGFVDFEDRESLIAALQKNDTPFFNRPIRVNLESEQKKRQQQHHQSGYHQQQQHSEQRSDEADWRRPPPPEQEQEAPAHQGGKSYSFNRYGQQQQQQGGYQRRSLGQQQHHQQQQQQQQYHQGQHRQHRPYSGYQQQQKQYRSSEHRETPELRERETPVGEQQSPSTSTTEIKERPKLNLQPRSKGLDEQQEENSGTQSTSIFGSAKPVNTAAREREIEQRLREKAEAEKVEKQKQQELQQQQQQQAGEEEQVQEEKEKSNESEYQTEAEQTKRQHKTSFTASEKSHTDSDFQVVGKPRYQNKNDNNNNNIRNQNRSNNQSGSYTSPPGYHHQQQRTFYAKKQPEHVPEAPRPPENAWKTKSAASDLFNKEASVEFRSTRNEHHNNDEQQQRRSFPPKRTEHQNRPQSDRPRDNKDRRNNDRNKQFNKNPRGERTFSNSNNENSKPVRPRAEGGYGMYNTEQSNANKNDLGFNVNKFSNLAIDVEDANEIYDNDEGDFEQEA